MANREQLFQEIHELEELQKASSHEMVALRGEQVLDARERTKAIFRAHPNTHEVHSHGGNSEAWIQRNDRIIKEHVSGSGAIHIISPDRENLHITLFPYGVVGTHSSGSVVFEDPLAAKRHSIVLSYPDYNGGYHWLQYPSEPLFNIDEYGNVFARINDAPTKAELQLLESILETYEAAMQTPQQQTA